LVVSQGWDLYEEGCISSKRESVGGYELYDRSGAVNGCTRCPGLLMRLMVTTEVGMNEEKLSAWEGRIYCDFDPEFCI